MRVSAKVDYALRAAVELAALEDDWPVKGERVASGQGIPLRFMENILGQLRQAGIVASRRGAEGGYLLLAISALVNNCLFTPGRVCSTDPGVWGALPLTWLGLLAIAGAAVAFRYRHALTGEPS